MFLFLSALMPLPGLTRQAPGPWRPRSLPAPGHVKEMLTSAMGASPSFHKKLLGWKCQVSTKHQRCCAPTAPTFMASPVQLWGCPDFQFLKASHKSLLLDESWVTGGNGGLCVPSFTSLSAAFGRTAAIAAQMPQITSRDIGPYRLKTKSLDPNNRLILWHEL